MKNSILALGVFFSICSQPVFAQIVTPKIGLSYDKIEDDGTGGATITTPKYILNSTLDPRISPVIIKHDGPYIKDLLNMQYFDVRSDLNQICKLFKYKGLKKNTDAYGASHGHPEWNNLSCAQPSQYPTGCMTFLLIDKIGNKSTWTEATYTHDYLAVVTCQK